MKKIAFLIILIVCCSATIVFAAVARSKSTMPDINKEMKSRLIILSEKADNILASEFTPFIWDEEYIYGGYSSQEKFTGLMGDKKVSYLDTYEYDHRELYFYNGIFQYDSKVINYYNDWFLNPVGEYILSPADWLKLSHENNMTLLYFN